MTILIWFIFILKFNCKLTRHVLCFISVDNAYFAACKALNEKPVTHVACQIYYLIWLQSVCALFSTGHKDCDELVADLGKALSIVARCEFKDILHVSAQKHSLLDMHFIERLFSFPQISLCHFLPPVLVHTLSVQEHKPQH